MLYNFLLNILNQFKNNLATDTKKLRLLVVEYRLFKYFKVYLIPD